MRGSSFEERPFLPLFFPTREKNAAILDWFDERLRPERVMREAPGGAP